MLAANVPVRAVAVDAPGSWDSHSDQANTIGRDVKNVFDTLLAFQRDIEARGIADRVLVHVWTEFGRRPQENAGGTDHGAAGASFLIGTKAAGQMVGEFPGLTSLDSAEQPEGHQRLPRRLLLAAGGLVRRRRRRRSSRARRASRGRRSSRRSARAGAGELPLAGDAVVVGVEAVVVVADRPERA